MDIKIGNKYFCLTTNLSNHNIAMLEFVRDGMVIDGNNRYFKEDGYNWWVMAYVGPWWKKWFTKDNDNSGTTKNPLEGLVACKKMLIYFIDNIMGDYDLIEVSGSTIQRDRIYHKVLSKMGFRFVESYNDSFNIMIYVKDNGTNEYIICSDVCKSKIPNPNNPWGSLMIHGFDFSKTPIYEEDDYDYKHHTMFYDTMIYPIVMGLKHIEDLYYDCISWLKIMWRSVRYKFKKGKIRKSRKSSV